MQHFQSILIVIGLLAIGGVLLHGYLLSRKEKDIVSETPHGVDLFAKEVAQETQHESDDGVISDVRIVSSNETPVEEDIDFSQALNNEKITPIEFGEEETPVTFNMDDQAELEARVIEPIISEAAIVEPIIKPQEVKAETPQPIVAEKKVQEVAQPQDLFIFNVVAQEGKELGGHELLQFFLTSGFRFGEMSIFHRHEHSDGTGPVLFSIANMMSPGVFEVENMEQFKSEGVSFFLTVPNANIDVKASFEMMLRAVEQMAEEFDCIVLNAEREPLTTEQFIEYNNRLGNYI